MSSKIFSLFFFLAIIVALGSSKVGAEEAATKKVLFMAEGVVHCQDCAFTGSWDLLNAKPLMAAKVSITCRDKRRRVACYKVADTDTNGYFIVPLDAPGMKNVEDLEKSCKVRLLAPPKDSTCSLLTNVNYGIQGAELRSQSKKYSKDDYDIEIYTVGPLVFKPKHCAPKFKY